ncbi:MAG: TetR/AcrR family transcriptional regulator [Candidatus Limivicinus sp.]|jgi:AcrR family transcriptional regulator
MPPRIKITRDMVSDAAFQIARSSDWTNINARNVAKQLNCSTQPVMYHFDTIEDIKKAAYEKADRFHTEYLMNIQGSEEPMLEIGLNYIRFSVKEPSLFRFLFQSGYGPHANLLTMIGSPELEPVLQLMMQAMNITMEKTKEVFTTLAIFAHGYASLLANHYMEYDEASASQQLTRAFYGAAAAAMEEER